MADSAFNVAIGGFTDGNGDGLVTFDIDLDPSTDGPDADNDPTNDFTISSEVTNAVRADSIAFGPQAQSLGVRSVAMGSEAGAARTSGVALGLDAFAAGESDTVLGSGVSDNGLFGFSTVIGSGAVLEGVASGTAVGTGSAAFGPNSGDVSLFGAFTGATLRGTALGVGATAVGRSTTAIGFEALSGNDGSLALGGALDRNNANGIEANEITNANARFATAVGSGAQALGAVNASANGWLANASAEHTTSLGANSAASAINATAAGRAAKANADNSVALGTDSVTDRANTVSVGAVGAERQVTNVADATQATDGVNLRQAQGGDAATLAAANDFTRTQFANATAEVVGEANARTDGQIAQVRTELAAGDAATLEAAKANAAAGDTETLAQAKADAAAADIATLAAANDFTDERIEQVLAFDFSAVNQRLDGVDAQVDELDARVQAQDQRISRNGAMAAAMAQMAINAAGAPAGHGRLAVGLGVQDGLGAAAFGYAHTFGRFTFSVGGAFSGEDTTFGLSVGAGL